MKNKRISGVIAALAAQIMFGFSFMFTKNATGIASPIELLSWRFVTAALFFLLLIKLGLFKVNFKGKDLKPALILAFLHPICYFLCENSGVSLTTASESGTIIAAIPICTLVLAVIFLKSKPSHEQVFGILIGIIGVLFTVLSQESMPTFNALGYLLLFGAVIAYSFFGLFSETTKQFDAVEKAVIMIFTGAVGFTSIAVVYTLLHGTFGTFIRLPFTSRGFLTAILYLSIGSSIIAFSCNNYSIATLGMTASATFSGVTTIVSVLAGVIFLGETFTLWQVIGMILIILGVFLANRTPHKA